MESHAESAIRTLSLTKTYKGVDAVQGLSLAVPRGAVYGFLGPNGAGKTTTIRILLGFIRATSGSATINGHDCWTQGVRARSGIGYLVPAEALYPEMSGLALLEHAATLSGVAPVFRTQALEALALQPEALRRSLRTYSKGMRQKIALVAAMQHDPEILILDEPTDGLDPLVLREFEQLLRDRQRAGRTIFMSSHDLAEVERLCDRVAVVRGGRLVAEESIGDMKRHHRRTGTLTFADTPPSLDGIPGVRELSRRGMQVDVSIEGEAGPLLAAMRDASVVDVHLPPARLEDIFMAFYGNDEVAP